MDTKLLCIRIKNIYLATRPFYISKTKKKTTCTINDIYEVLAKPFLHPLYSHLPPGNELISKHSSEDAFQVEVRLDHADTWRGGHRGELEWTSQADLREESLEGRGETKGD